MARNIEGNYLHPLKPARMDGALTSLQGQREEGSAHTFLRNLRSRCHLKQSPLEGACVKLYSEESQVPKTQKFRDARIGSSGPEEGRDGTGTEDDSTEDPI